MQEKIKVNLSYNVFNLLQKDSEDFKFYIKNDCPNKNLFYNTIIKNMFIGYKTEIEFVRNKISNILINNKLSPDKYNNIVDELENLFIYKNEDKTNRSHGYYISIRPSKKNEYIFNEIELYELKNNTISNYYRNIFNRYANLPQDERERIIFKDELKIIESAISNKKALTIKLNKTSLEILPYALVRTNDELYNYLIGIIRKNGTSRLISIHLYKCVNIYKSKQNFTFNNDEIEQLNNAIVIGPREIERRTIITKIKLTKHGIRKFKSMYLNRPIPIEINDDIYTFNCSHENLFLYFSRFGSDALVLEPLNLRNQLINFHKKAFNKYNN